jgi:ATPase subunit of ABC transporter with duplicated ATPase domains
MRSPLQVSEIRKQFGHKLALDGVTLSVRAGGAVAIGGENGSRKTTLLRIWAGLIRPREPGEHFTAGRWSVGKTPAPREDGRAEQAAAPECDRDQRGKDRAVTARGRFGQVDCACARHPCGEVWGWGHNEVDRMVQLAE